MIFSPVAAPRAVESAAELPRPPPVAGPASGMRECIVLLKRVPKPAERSMSSFTAAPLLSSGGGSAYAFHEARKRDQGPAESRAASHGEEPIT